LPKNKRFHSARWGGKDKIGVKKKTQLKKKKGKKGGGNLKTTQISHSHEREEKEGLERRPMKRLRTSGQDKVRWVVRQVMRGRKYKLESREIKEMGEVLEKEKGGHYMISTGGNYCSCGGWEWGDRYGRALH